MRDFEFQPSSIFSIVLFAILSTYLFSCTSSSSSETPLIADSKLNVKEMHDNVLKELDFSNQLDFENADKGFLGTLEDPKILNEDGSVAIDLSWFDFLNEDAPATANPSLWRQSQLNRKHGLYKVTDNIYQIRGFDLANMTIIETETGRIVIDPLTTIATAKAGMKLVNRLLGDRPVKAMIITHSHIDHFGGMKGIATEKEVEENNIEIIAPEGFFEHAISENVIGGNAMKRRATYMFGHLLKMDAKNMIGNGLGQKVSAGKTSIMKPTIEINKTGQTLTIDGLELVFQNTPGAEAPSECMFYIPKYKAFCQAEEINHNMHNLYTLRGAQVRNGLKWAKYIDETVQMFGDKTEVSFGCHHWPMWGKENILELWTKQRDLYKFIHDETLYWANQGYNMNEVAERVKLPESLSSFFANRGYYGTLSHNVKAQYQLYFGWFDGNPANLHPLPPSSLASNYVEYMGGADAVIEKVKVDIDNGEYRWAATVLNHVVFDNPKNQDARNLLASVYKQLGYAAESGPWRNFYLTGAQELQSGILLDYLFGVTTTDDILINLTLEDFYDYMAVRLDRRKLKGQEYQFNMVFPDIDEVISLHLVNDVLHNRPGVFVEDANATITMNKTTFNDIITQKSTGVKKLLAGEIKIEGSRKDYSSFQNLIKDPFNLLFNIVEP